MLIGPHFLQLQPSTRESSLESNINNLPENSGETPTDAPTCDICGRIFKGQYGKYNLKRHLTIHAGLKPYTCSVCSMKFNRKEAKQKHEYEMHFILDAKLAMGMFSK